MNKAMTSQQKWDYLNTRLVRDLLKARTAEVVNQAPPLSQSTRDHLLSVVNA